MLNKSPSGYFTSNRGIRQGDCLSPYIFVLVMEFFSIHMDLTLAAGTIKPIENGGEQVASHLLFADNMLIFSKGNVVSLKAIVTRVISCKHWISYKQTEKQSILQ